MQDLIKRYFWVLGGVVVAICAVFVAKATGHVVEAKFLGDAEHGPKIAAVVTHLDTTAPTAQSHSKDGGQITSRNIFCSDCTPPVPVVVAGGSPGDPNSGVQITALPLALLATNIGATKDASYATIINSENQRQGAYSVGDPIPGASGKLKEIHFKYIDFENNGHAERLMLVGVTPSAAPPEAPAVAVGDGSGDELQASIDSGIKKIDDSHYEVDKALIDKVLLNPMAFAKGARVVPSLKNGKPDGFKLYAIRPGSAFAKLGLSNGDTLQAINSFELTSADQAIEVYTKLRTATSLEVDVTRRGKPVTLNYTIK